MRLVDLQIQRSPGLPLPFGVKAKGGVNLIVGPNGSGKTSLTRAVFSLLWPGTDPADGARIVRAVFDDGDGPLIATREDGRPVQWTRNGQPITAPPLPTDHVAQCYDLGLQTLIVPDAGDVDQTLARELRTQMAGGYNLDGLVEDLFPLRRQAGSRERGFVLKAEEQLRLLQKTQTGLAQRQAQMADLNVALQQAQAAENRRRLLELVRDYVNRDLERHLAQRTIDSFPIVCAQVRDEDPQTLARLRETEQKSQDQLAALDLSLAKQETAIAELSAFTPDVPTLPLPPLQDKVRQLERLHEGYDQAQRLLSATTSSAQQAAQHAPSDIQSNVDPELYRILTRLHARLSGHAAKITELVALQTESDRSKTTGQVWGWISAVVGVVGLGGSFFLTSETGGGAPMWSSLAALIVGTLGLGYGVFHLGRIAAAKALIQKNHVRWAAQRATEDAQMADTSAELEHVCRTYDLDSDLATVDLLSALKAAALKQDADLAQAHAQGELDGWQTQIAARLDDINTHLTGANLEPVDDVFQAAHQVKAIAERRTQLDQLQQTIEQEKSHRDLVTNTLARSREDFANLCERLDLDPKSDPDQQVARLLEQRPHLDAAVKKHEAASHDLDRLDQDIRRRCDDAQRSQLLSMDPNELERQIADQTAAAATVADLQREIAEIKADVGAAQRSETLARALAESEARMSDLADARQQSRQTALGRMLVDRIKAQYETTTRPPVLAAARDYFKLFTQGRYTLDVLADTGGQGRFQAIDADTRRPLDLDQLSDGARAQLLLAVRLGFITATEKTSPLPLFLDDALTASDPQRFNAIATALGRLAQDLGRQVFFLTPDPTDVQAWHRALADNGLPAPHDLDLAAIRKLAEAGYFSQTAGPKSRPLPDPQGLTAQQYATALQVPEMDLWAAETSLHLFYLLDDNLPLLRRLLVAATSSVGRWQQMRSTLLATEIVSPAEADLLDGRCLLWGSFLDGWRIGRGRPVTLRDLEKSDAVSGTMLPRVGAVLKTVRYDGARLMDALLAGEVKGFLTKKRDQLQTYLELVDCLDSKPVLTEEELLEHVIKAVGQQIRSGNQDPQQVRLRVLMLAGRLENQSNARP